MVPAGSSIYTVIYKVLIYPHTSSIRRALTTTTTTTTTHELGNSTVLPTTKTTTHEVQKRTHYLTIQEWMNFLK
ncbi:hypothetical protein Pcinc_029371 [Petrolisthes cinctipes]|uniref:Uncharacterized protein n=1 Tax=Petrolisthes cinctipes TaxID=88211 RepID=A0AAE1F0H6_PETCI|nr:hypothetical protein Pcinc_029371 [Petrolisthes cinctipes]